MKSRFFSLMIVMCIFSLTHANAENSPIPIKVLDQEILDEFIPQVLQEVDKTFIHQSDVRTRRDTREYGFSFFKMLNEDFTYDPPPAFFQELGKHICKALGHEPPDAFTNIILSVYKKDFHLKPHVDVNNKDFQGKTSFCFSERVYAIIIESDPTGHLYFAKWEGEESAPPLDLPPVFSLQEQPGTIFCLEGDYRYMPYLHGVSSVSNHRISITFRTVEKN